MRVPLPAPWASSPRASRAERREASAYEVRWSPRAIRLLVPWCCATRRMKTGTVGVKSGKATLAIKRQGAWLVNGPMANVDVSRGETPLAEDLLEFDWSSEDARHREEVRVFLDEILPDDWEEIAKHGPGSDGQAAFSKTFCAAMAERGWLTQHWPAEYGGRDASPWRHSIVGEEMWAIGEPRGSQYMNVNWIGPAIMRFGTEPQKALHLPRISAGDVLWCQGFSEPEAGSDLAALRTLALRDGDDYVINGSKIWTSYVENAEFIFLLVRTDPDSSRQRGVSVLLCPVDTPGVEVREIPSVVGARYFHEVFFSEARVPVAGRLGGEGEGWDVVHYALQYERVGAARYARAARTLDRLAEIARVRGRLEDRLIVERLAEARAVCEAARVLTYKVIDVRAKGGAPTADTQIARVAGTRADARVADLALEILGAEALEYGSYADANFRLAMTAGVAVGATEVQLNLIASRFLGLPRE
jgi:alkylation response protein AidB-like acyl-CoA dehydrogenase